jgi:hypothetical protein
MAFLHPGLTLPKFFTTERKKPGAEAVRTVSAPARETHSVEESKS